MWHPSDGFYIQLLLFFQLFTFIVLLRVLTRIDKQDERISQRRSHGHYKDEESVGEGATEELADPKPAWLGWKSREKGRWSLWSFKQSRKEPTLVAELSCEDERAGGSGEREQEFEVVEEDSTIASQGKPEQ